MPSDKPLISFVADKDWLKRVDNYRFAHRFTSRAAAIKWLVEWALAKQPIPPYPKD